MTGPTGPDGGARPVALVLRALGLGDLLTAVPALRALRRGLSDHEVVLATSPGMVPLVPAVGAIDRVVPVDGRRSLPWPPPEPWPSRPAIAVDLHGRGPESHRALLATAPARLIAFAAEVDEVVVPGPRWRDDEHEVARWCRLVAAHGFTADPADLELDRAALPAAPASCVPAGTVVLHPGASTEQRCWPAARWAVLAAALVGRGQTVVVTGAASERPLAEAVAVGAGLPAGAILAGTGDVADLAVVVARAGLLISGDTGPAHLATALHVPSVVLFGATSPSQWGPPPDRPRHQVLWVGDRRPAAVGPDPGLLAIGVDDVLAAAARAVGAATVAPPPVATPARAVAADPTLGGPVGGASAGVGRPGRGGR